MIVQNVLFFLLVDGLPDTPRPVNSLAPQAWHSSHKLIYVRPNPKTGVPVGHWPIPESFWPDQNSPTLVSSFSACIRSLQWAVRVPSLLKSTLACQALIQVLPAVFI